MTVTTDRDPREPDVAVTPDRSGSTATGTVGHRLPAAYLDEEALSPYEPIGVTPRYAPPRATIHPDKERGWLRRVWPIVRAHRVLLFASLAAAVVAMFSSVAVPAVL